MHFAIELLSTTLIASGLAILSGCAEHSSAAEEARNDTAPPKDELPQGVVRLRPGAGAFIAVEAANPSSGHAALRVPARVAFRDEAVSKVGTPAAGRVTRVHVRVGAKVEAGQPLLTIESSEAAAARAALSTAEAALTEAKATADRTRDMVEKGIGTESERIAAEVKLATATAEVARAKAALALIGEGEGATVTLRASISGVVTELRASVGTAVAPAAGDPLVELGNPSKTWIVGDVFERDLPLIHEGTPVELELSSISGRLRGKVTSIAPVVNLGLRTAPIYIELDESPGELRPGMFGRAFLEAAGTSITLPSEAVLIKDDARTVVYVAQKNGTYAMREVRVGQSVEGRVQILSGLGVGEEVVVRGALLVDSEASQLL